MAADPIDELCAEAADLCRRLAPLDLADVPLYVVPASRVPKDRGGDTCHLGFTAPSLDLHLRGAIGRGWRGRGEVIVLRDEAAEGMAGVSGRELFLTVAVHELAHILDRDAVNPDAPADPDRLDR